MVPASVVKAINDTSRLELNKEKLRGVSTTNTSSNLYRNRESDRNILQETSPFLSNKSSSDSDIYIDEGNEDEIETQDDVTPSMDSNTALLHFSSVNNHVNYSNSRGIDTYSTRYNLSQSNLNKSGSDNSIHKNNFVSKDKVCSSVNINSINDQCSLDGGKGTGTGTGKIPHPDDFRRRLVPHADIFSRPLPIFPPPPDDDVVIIEAENLFSDNSNSNSNSNIKCNNISNDEGNGMNVGENETEQIKNEDGQLNKNSYVKSHAKSVSTFDCIDNNNQKCKYYPVLVFEMIGGVMCVFDEKDRNERIQKSNVSNITSNNNSMKSHHDDNCIIHTDNGHNENHNCININNKNDNDSPYRLNSNKTSSPSNSSYVSKNNSEGSLREREEEKIRKNKESGNLFPVLTIDEFVQDFNYVSTILQCMH